MGSYFWATRYLMFSEPFPLFQPLYKSILCKNINSIKLLFQSILIIAETFSDIAANLICRDLGFVHAIDWVDYVDRGQRYYRRTGYVSNISIEYYMLLSDLHCGGEAETFDDCSYNMTMVHYLSSAVFNYIILSCNPAPGKTLTVLYIKLKVVNKNCNCSCQRTA